MKPSRPMASPTPRVEWVATTKTMQTPLATSIQATRPSSESPWGAGECAFVIRYKAPVGRLPRDGTLARQNGAYAYPLAAVAQKQGQASGPGRGVAADGGFVNKTPGCTGVADVYTLLKCRFPCSTYFLC